VLPAPRRLDGRPSPDSVGAASAKDWPEAVGADSVAALVDAIWDLSRTRTLVILTPVPGYQPRLLLDPARLAALVSAEAELAVLADHAATQLLCAALPDRLRFGTGSARLFYPGANPRDHPCRHPWIFVDRSRPRQAEEMILAFLRSRPPVWSSTDHRPEHDKEAPEPDRLAVERELAEARTRLGVLSKDKKRLLRELAEARSATAGREPSRIPTVFADPERQFCYEVEQLWLWTHPEAERAEYALAGFTAGPDWFESLAAIQVVDRGAVVAAVIDVLTGRAVVKNGRRVHRQRVGKGGGTAPLTRADGAAAWRCDIRSATPAAPRLLWWVLPDGRIELAKAAVHDDSVMR
jgi:hypothetical protein